MTERLYYRNAWLASFDARVVERSDSGRRLYLDRTAFYPTSGGQPHDLGTVAGVQVDDVIDEGERIAHVLSSPVDVEMVHGEIDWPRRFDHMQQHTGQHLISAVFADAFAHQTVSVHFGREYSTLDLDADVIDLDQLREAERQANQIAAENRPVTISFEDAAVATGLRKSPGREGQLRIVNIEGIDRSACGGTHVDATGEIGAVLLRRQERVRKAARIEFVCGLRAVRRARQDFESLAGIAHQLSASIDDVPALAMAQLTETKDLQGRVRRLEGELQVYRARERYDAVVPDPRGRRRIVERAATGSPEAWRAFALAICALPMTIFVVGVETPPAILVASSPDADFDAGKRLRAALDVAGGRGGGSSRLAQASLPSRDALDRALSLLEDAEPNV